MRRSRRRSIIIDATHPSACPRDLPGWGEGRGREGGGGRRRKEEGGGTEGEVRGEQGEGERRRRRMRRTRSGGLTRRTRK